MDFVQIDQNGIIFLLCCCLFADVTSAWHCGIDINLLGALKVYDLIINQSFSDDQSPLKIFSRMKRWKQISGGNIQIFFADILVMGIMRRGNAAKYWSACNITKLNFFGKYLSRNAYQMPLSHFHCAPNRNNPPKGAPGHDPLHKVRPLVEMCQRNFHLKYRPGKCLSFDEGSCGFCRRVKFLTYNKDKPQKWAIKLFEVADAENEFVCGFDVYCGKNETSCANNAKTEKIDHEEYILKIVEYLLEEGNKTRVLRNPPDKSGLGRKLKFGDHFPEHIPRKEGTKRKPSRPCFACNGSWEDMRKKILPKRCSGIWCKVCKKVLCVTPCFDIFHTNENFRELLLQMRFGYKKGVGNKDVVI